MGKNASNPWTAGQKTRLKNETILTLSEWKNRKKNKSTITSVNLPCKIFLLLSSKGVSSPHHDILKLIAFSHVFTNLIVTNKTFVLS